MDNPIDLTMPIADHFRWPVDRRTVADHARGDMFQVTYLGFAVHGFTHMDSPRHYFPDGKTTDDIALERTIGEAAVIDLLDIEPMTPIDSARLDKSRRSCQGRGDHRLQDRLGGAARIDRARFLAGVALSRTVSRRVALVPVP